MTVKFNVAMHHTAQGAHQIVDLTWIGNPNCVGNPHPVDANLVYGTING